MGDKLADSSYWVQPWSSILFSGDLFDAIPFGLEPTELYTIEGDPVQHFQGQVAFAYGLLISPTCDMYEATNPPKLAHSYRVLVPVIDLARVIEMTQTVQRNLDQIRSRDHLTAYMYLPALKGHFAESVAILYRPTLVSDKFLAEPPRRIAQMHHLGRRHLKVKLAAYWGRAQVNEEELPLKERDEEATASTTWPRSGYDTGEELAT